MTGDLGPDEVESPDLPTVFEPHVVSAAGLAAERHDDEAETLLNAAADLDVSFASTPITTSGGASKALVDVVLLIPGDVVRQASQDVLTRAADLLSEAAAGDGYRVRDLRVRATAPGGRRSDRS